MEHLRNLEKRYGIDVRVYNPIDVSSFQPTEKAKLIWLEAAGSVTLEFPDLVGLVKKAQTHHVRTALDNTWGAGLAFNAFDFSDEHLSVDVTVHALTKYPSGGGDILMGSVVTRERALHHQLFRTHAIQGISVSGDDVAQVQRSLASMRVRYAAQSESALQLLAWLKQQPEFVQVLHPADSSAAGHSYWKDICVDQHSAGLVSVIFKPEFDLQDIRQFCDALSLFKLGFSWGGPVSLVMLYDLKDMRALEHTHLQQGLLVRFCIGLEHPNDLILIFGQLERTIITFTFTTFIKSNVHNSHIRFPGNLYSLIKKQSILSPSKRNINRMHISKIFKDNRIFLPGLQRQYSLTSRYSLVSPLINQHFRTNLQAEPIESSDYEPVISSLLRTYDSTPSHGTVVIRNTFVFGSNMPAVTYINNRIYHSSCRRSL
jgi:cystathionine beta-lyase/cystathionine gamma-synthase